MWYKSCLSSCEYLAAVICKNGQKEKGKMPMRYGIIWTVQRFGMSYQEFGLGICTRASGANSICNKTLEPQSQSSLEIFV